LQATSGSQAYFTNFRKFHEKISGKIKKLVAGEEDQIKN
jgi:hypothetical protein